MEENDITLGDHVGWGAKRPKVEFWEVLVSEEKY